MIVNSILYFLEKFFVIVEFARNGSLLEYLKKSRTKPEEKLDFELNYFNRLKIALDVAKGMSHLAKIRVISKPRIVSCTLLVAYCILRVASRSL